LDILNSLKRSSSVRAPIKKFSKSQPLKLRTYVL
jgi:hypothetical protein